MSDTGIVVIGRNEGERLRRCLESLPPVPTLYVDSGSSDGSLDLARSLGVTTLALDPATPFTAARARNEGAAALLAASPELQFLQTIDGDCFLAPGWIDAARTALAADTKLGAVYGVLREVAPERSIYNWLCDREWASRPGPTPYFGGLTCFRAACFPQAATYDAGLIAGEERDLSIRLATMGWRFEALAAPMAWHDAQMTRFGQWWTRAVRGGVALTTLARRHRGNPHQNFGRRFISMFAWGGILPLILVLAIAAAIIKGSPSAALLAALLGAGYLIQMLRIAIKASGSPAQRLALGGFTMLAKTAQCIGALRAFARQPKLIEYRALND